jgi:hypothetical protein
MLGRLARRRSIASTVILVHLFAAHGLFDDGRHLFNNSGPPLCGGFALVGIFLANSK